MIRFLLSVSLLALAGCGSTVHVDSGSLQSTIGGVRVELKVGSGQ